MKRPLVEPKPRDSPAEEVHIIPLGWEHDRAALPFLRDLAESKRLPVHRVYLVVPDPQGGKGFQDRVEKTLAKHWQVQIRPVKRRDPEGRHIEFEEVVAEVARLCALEIGLGNRVHINMSAGSKIGALAAGLAGMAYVTAERGSIYYVEPEHYSESDPCEYCGKTARSRPLSRGIKSVRTFEPVTLDLPDRFLMLALGFLAKRPSDKASFTDLLQFLCKIEAPGFEDVSFTEKPQRRIVIKGQASEPAVRMRLLRQVIHPLEEGGFVRTDRKGREHLVLLLPRGRAYARFSPQSRY